MNQRPRGADIYKEDKEFWKSVNHEPVPECENIKYSDDFSKMTYCLPMLNFNKAWDRYTKGQELYEVLYDTIDALRELGEVIEINYITNKREFAKLRTDDYYCECKTIEIDKKNHSLPS